MSSTASTRCPVTGQTVDLIWNTDTPYRPVRVKYTDDAPEHPDTRRWIRGVEASMERLAPMLMEQAERALVQIWKVEPAAFDQWTWEW